MKNPMIIKIRWNRNEDNNPVTCWTKVNEVYEPYKSFISTFIVPRISGKIGVKVRPTSGQAILLGKFQR